MIKWVVGLRCFAPPLKFLAAMFADVVHRRVAMRRVVSAALGVSLLFPLSGPLGAQTLCGPATNLVRYVSPGGNDANNGQSPATAFRQIRQALTVVQPGSTVWIADGIYLGFTAQNISGTTSNPITLRASGSNAFINATTDRVDNRDNMLLSFCAHLVIDGLNATNAPRAGMRIDACQFVTVRNGRFGNNGTWGIFTDFSDDLRIEGNECYGSVLEHGIYHSNSGDRPIIRVNRCHDNDKNGIHLNGDVSEGGDGMISGAIIEQNAIYNNGTGGGGGINMDGVEDSVIRNNLIYDNHAGGITMYGIDAAHGPQNNLVAHNTIDQAADGRWAILIQDAVGPITLRNNIVHQRHGFRGVLLFESTVDAAFTDSDYNAFGGNCMISTDDGGSSIALATWQAGGHDAHSFCHHITNLVVSAPGNYDLKTNSPARNAGITLTNVTHDIEYRPRPEGAAVDIGAYEVGAVLPAPRVDVHFAGPDICLGFPSLIGKRYELQRTADLLAGFDQIVTNDVRGTGEKIFLRDPNVSAQPRMLYRVRISP